MNGGFRFLTSGGGTAHINVPLPALAEGEQIASVQLTERVLPESVVPDFSPGEAAAESKEEAEANAGSLANLASLAKKAGLALVPLETAIKRNAEALAQAQPLPLLPPEEAATDDLAGLDVQGSTQTIMPGAAPASSLQAPNALTVLGGKAPTVPVFQPQQPLMVGMSPQQQQLYSAAMPIMTPQAIMTAATGPLVVVDTSPQALAREVIEDVGVGGMNAGAAAAQPQQVQTIRRAPRRVAFASQQQAQAAPAPSGPTNVTVNKLG